MSDHLKEAFSDIPSDIAEAVKDYAVETWNEKAVHAFDRQAAIAASNERDKPKAVDGLGYLDMQVDSQIFHWWNAKLPGCWRDKDFRNWFKKNYPTTVVHSGGTGKTMVLMPGFLNRATA